ncbi:hypothetical protein SAMN05444166_5109 [Singulisphaera sp. GP187]|nr:hypothetical protein SAMN05444166_5109 [Singulisphaera sp. GP187]
MPGFEALEGRVVLSTFTVTNTNDDGGGSLRAAIDLANADPAQDTINFAVSATGTIRLRSALPDLTTAIILIGPGASALTVARSADPSTPEFRIFNVTAGAEVAISGLTISGGRVSAESGGGIANHGTLAITDSTLSGNSAGFNGGGIDNYGTLAVTRSTLSGNSARYGAGGIDNSTLHGTVKLTQSILSGNSAGTGGGIGNSTGTVTITNSTLSGNSAVYNGGGISNAGTVTVTHSTLSDNSAGFNGGAISNYNAVTITNSTLSGNSAGAGGAIANSSYAGTVTIAESTFGGNSADPGGGGGIANHGTVTVTTSLFANSAGGNLAQAASGSFASKGSNLFSDTPTVALDPTDLIDTDPRLAPLADNGGPTQTMALLPGSPAIDAGRVVPGITVDQRGVPRPQGAAPDIGAFESRGFTLVILSGNNQSATGGSAFPIPLVVRIASPFGEPVAGGRVRFAGPTTGASASFTGNPAPIDANGLASVVATANSLGGPYAVTAQVSGKVVGLTFALENLVMPPPVVGPTVVGPTVVGLQRYGFHAQPTTLVLRFSAALDPGRVQDLANYQIVTLGGRGLAGSRVGHVTRVRAAVYDPATQTVTLHPARRLNPRHTYRLTVRGTGPGGLASPTGVLLDGGGTGQPGSDFLGTIHRETLVGSSRAFFNQIRHRWAGQGGISQGQHA